MTIDIERKTVSVTEHQKFAEVCLIKSGPSYHPIMALGNAEELTGNVGSPRESVCVNVVMDHYYKNKRAMSINALNKIQLLI